MTVLLFLPAEAGDPWRWLRIEGGDVAARGEGVPAADDAPVIAVAPAAAVALHWATLPDRSAAQALAAARILAAEASASPAELLHVAIGAGEGDGRPVAVVAADRMRGWLALLAAAGIDPAGVIPAPLLLPAPDEGYVRADLGGQSVVRGATSGFADEAALTATITGGVVPVTMTREAVERAIVAAVAEPALNLRQGAFARKRRRAIDPAVVRRLAVLAGLVLLATLAVDLMRITRYALAADRLEAQADALARQGLPRGAETGDAATGDAGRLLDARLSRLRGPGLGFSRMGAAVLAALRATPGTEAQALDFQPNGDLRVTIAADGAAQANALRSRLRDAGFAVSAGVFEPVGGRVKGDITVSRP